MSRGTRLGAVSYLNTRPLTVLLETADSGFELEYAVPAVCAAQLATRRVDVGLVPVIEYARAGEPYWIVPRIAIGCLGEVLTVRLFYRGNLNKLRRVALDCSSRTSIALLRILMHHHWQIEPDLVECPPDLEAMMERADGALLIGDPVFEALDGPVESIDLGQAWLDFCGLPFVFAFWAGRQNALDSQQVRQLVNAALGGRQLIGQLAREYAHESGGPVEVYERYLAQHIRYDLDEKACQGLALFLRLARERGLVEQEPPLRFYPL